MIILICSDDENAFTACSSFMKDAIKGAHAQLDLKIRQSSKMCYIYEVNMQGKKMRRSSDSIMHCLKDVLAEIQNWEKFPVSSWMFLKKSSIGKKVLSVSEPSTKASSFFNTKLLNISDKGCQNMKFSSSKLSLENHSNELKPSNVHFKDEWDKNSVGAQKEIDSTKMQHVSTYPPGDQCSPKSFNLIADSQDTSLDDGVNDCELTNKALFNSVTSILNVKGSTTLRKNLRYASLENIADVTPDSWKKTILEDLSLDYGQKNGLTLRKLKMTYNKIDSDFKVQKVSFGSPSPNVQNRVILLVGADGSGKSTLINLMINFIFRVEFIDNFRLILVDEGDAHKLIENQTKIITAYVINYQPGMTYVCNYILIDAHSPGLGDGRGIHSIQCYYEMMVQLESFLKQGNGIDQLDLLGIVTPASTSKFHDKQKYIFNGLISLFGKDIKDNVCLMATFDNRSVYPPVVAAMKEAQINFNWVFKFNNGVLYSPNKIDHDGQSDQLISYSNLDEDDEVYISNLLWNLDYKSLKCMFQQIERTAPVGLALSRPQ